MANWLPNVSKTLIAVAAAPLWRNFSIYYKLDVYKYSISSLSTAAPLEVEVSPTSLRVEAWSPFNFSCKAKRGSDPVVIYTTTGIPVDRDPRFRVQRPNPLTVLVHAPYGIHAYGNIAKFM